MTKSEFLSEFTFRGPIDVLSERYCFHSESIFRVGLSGLEHVANVRKVTDRYIHCYTSVVHVSIDVRVPLKSLRMINPVSKEGGSNV